MSSGHRASSNHSCLSFLSPTILTPPGLERYEKVLSEVKADPKSYSPDKLRSSLDSFRTVLFDHLRDEVHDLGAESVFSHGFTLNELRRFPM